MTASATEPSSAATTASNTATTPETTTPGAAAGAELSGPDRFMLRLLRLPAPGSVVAPSADAARSAFQTSIALSGLRCLITYILLPFVAPFVGLAASIGEPLGIVVAVVAIISIISSMRRFWRSRHKQRWAYTILGGVMMCFLFFLLATDISNL